MNKDETPDTLEQMIHTTLQTIANAELPEEDKAALKEHLFTTIQLIKNARTIAEHNPQAAENLLNRFQSGMNAVFIGTNKIRETLEQDPNADIDVEAIITDLDHANLRTSETTNDDGEELQEEDKENDTLSSLHF